MTAFRRLAIVNRGEPAMRALNAVAELNRENDDPPITTIALYTDPDARAWFVREADEAIALGPATTVDEETGTRRSAYLDEARVERLLVEAKVDAVWVGWGFVAESPTFAQRCEDAGIVFIGPHAATIRHLGDKVAAKRLAESVGVPVVPWSGGPVTDAEDAVHHAERLGYPVMLKALAGGGGRGMRLVRNRQELLAALPGARAEAELAFGDPGVFLERLVEDARHVEVQIIADQNGTTWAVGVRDCSLQRRHQKVVEESASTVLDAAGEAAVKAAAVRLTSSAQYVGAGTVEFLVPVDGGQALFMEVNTRLQVEHPVTEETTGLDLVKLQLRVARGGRLVGEPPAVRGHAIEVRVNAEDAEAGFVPAPGRVALLRAPAGPGVRVDLGVTEGETISSDFDAMIAKVIAWGRDRDEALARLQRGLAQSSIVVENGTTNRSFLIGLLDHPDVRAGRFDTRWLDRMTAGEALLPAPDPVAVLAAAVGAYDADDAAVQAAFHATASRGRPEVPDESGHRVKLRYRGVPYELGVFRTGPRRYRVRTDAGPVDLAVEALGDFERRFAILGRQHRVMTVHQGSSMLVSVGGTTHRVHRDDGGAVRAGWPAFVLAVLVAPGDVVVEGQPLLSLESMKMESTVAAPYAGRVVSIDVTANAQVEIGAPLLRLQSADDAATTTGRGAAVDFAPLVSEDVVGLSCEWVYEALRGYLLGYDLDAGSLHDLMAAHRRVLATCAVDDPALLAEEDRLIELFADVAVLYRPQRDPDRSDLTERSEQEYLLAFLQWLDADRAGLPPSFRVRLERALARYGVAGLERTPQLEDAVVWMFRSFRRVAELVPVVLAVLERRLHDRDALAPLAGPQLRALLDRLVQATQSRHHVVADLARDVRFRLFDEALLDRVTAEVYAEMDGHLDALTADPDRPDREARIARLVWSPQPMRPVLLHRWHDGDAAVRRIVLEVYARRFYRIRPLEPAAFDLREGVQLCSAEYDHEDGRVHVVCGFAPRVALAGSVGAVAAHLRDVPADRMVVVDLTTWHPGVRHDADTVCADLLDELARHSFGRPLHRLDVTVTSESGPEPESLRTQHFTFRQGPGGFVEEMQYRNLHPMIAKRINLWRLSNFAIRRLSSPEDVYLFHTVAHENPKDQRLMAIAEVRDLTPVTDETGRVISLPRLERIGLLSLAAMRDALTAFPQQHRPQMNRVVIYVRPPWTLPREQWREFARKFEPLGIGVGLEKVHLRVQLPDDSGGLRDAVLQIEGIGERGGVTVRELPPAEQPVRPLTEYQQKVLRAHRTGAPYPYEIVSMLTPPRGIPADFPPGTFVEHDLGPDGRLVPVERPPGKNTANVVVGLITNRTATVPEGITRVVILGDPTRGLGALAEAECRRIVAAIGLAEERRLPVEWFALSSGARIAMDSGVENMDWIGAVLRRLIEFTQAGGEVNVVVTGINVGAQPYWNAEATMLMHTRGILVMTPASAMVLTGKQALDFSGGVSAEDNFGIGGFERIMGRNGQGQYWAPDLAGACDILLRHYAHTYVVPGERFPRRAATADPVDRDVRTSPHTPVEGSDFTTVGDVFSVEKNPERKKAFDIRSVMRAVTDSDSGPLERWASWQEAESAVVWDARIGGIAVCLIGLESRTVARRGFVPADGPPNFTSGTLFPQSSRKVARAINGASGNRPVVVLANLSGFDGSPESMRRRQLEYGAEIGRAVTNFRGPIVFVVISRYHGGAFVVFSKRLNDGMEIAAVEGSYASVIGGAPAAAVVFARDVDARTERDPRVAELRELVAQADREGDPAGHDGLRRRLHETLTAARAEHLGEVAAEFDRIHSVERARSVGSVDRIIPASELRPYLVDALVRGMQRGPAGGTGDLGVPAPRGTPTTPISAEPAVRSDP